MEGFEANHLGSLGNTGPFAERAASGNETPGPQIEVVVHQGRTRGPGKGVREKGPPESPRDSSPEVAVAGATDCHVKPSGAEPGLVVTLGQI
ncbi:unnamed protein product [Boreogadus saida]